MFKRNRGKNSELAQGIVTSDAVRKRAKIKPLSYAPKKLLVTKNTLPLAWVLIVLVLIGGSLLTVKLVQHAHSAGIEHRHALIDTAANLLDPQQSSELGKTVNDIQKTPGYTNDPNALYVMTIYYINIGDADKAQNYLNMLKSKHVAVASYQTSLQATVGWRSPASLQQDVDFLNMNAKQTLENTKQWQ